MSKERIATCFSKAITTYSSEASVQRQIAGRMIDLLTTQLPSPCSRVMEFGCGTGIYSRLLYRKLCPETLLLNDLCPGMRHCYDDLLAEEHISFLAGDAENLVFPAGNDLITSCSALQWFDSPERFFKKCHSLLAEQGYLAFSTFGRENLREIRRLTGNGLPYRSLSELTAALAPHFEVLHAEEELIPLTFDDPMKVLYHLKQTGVNGLPAPSDKDSDPEKKSTTERQWTRRDLRLFCDHYNRLFGQGTSVPLTYHPIYIIAKKKEV